MKKALAAFGPSDFLILLGLSGLFYGLYLVSISLAFIVVGSLLAVLGFVLAWPRRSR